MIYFCPNCEKELFPWETCDCLEQEAVNRKMHKRNKQNVIFQKQILGGYTDERWDDTYSCET